MDLRGARVGRYDVWGPIGQGGMGRVWLARHVEFAVPAVLKTLLECDGGAQLGNEARLMARIPSHRVVRVIDIGVHDDAAYLAEEYVDGLDLAELDERRRKALGRGLPLWFVCFALREVAEAVHSAHQTGILHRDIKPSNILGSPQLGLRLGDFGLAVSSEEQRPTPSGTAHFIAPEIFRGERATRASDVYSLGATAYVMRYGRHPFASTADLAAGKPSRFPSASTAEESYFQHIVGQMLAIDPAERMRSMVLPRKLLRRLERTLRPSFQFLSSKPGVFQAGPVRIRCVVGDISRVCADGIINSANDQLSMETGVGRALRDRGGSAIEDEARRGGDHALGDVITTSAGSLQCKYVLHAVSAWREASCIGRTMQRALLIAEELGLRSLAIPAIGTGKAQVTREACAHAMASALSWHLRLGGSRLREIQIVLYDQETLDIFKEELCGVFVGSGSHDEAGLLAEPAADSVASDDTTLWPGGESSDS